ncbi:MAG: ABC transporter ATP-binding protein [Comamonadaceae bacterium CG1_02_60_18]|nr:MAG: ABC transporter ATP-binding protein [Comamonadaceae bacterium CG1_02_60_18]PIQ54841.1 MAG: ABC transporter ATP-binding protein [Comamonadaceae bacterium CG12_big_fil_rev_8_21_14_0_65_59_15]
MSLLQLNHISKAYGALTVIDGISLTVAKGEALGIIGPNGAGKTTLFNLIAGNVQSDVGTVNFKDHDITALAPSARCHLGIGRTYQVPHPFGGMTVFENVLVGATFGANHSEREGTNLALDTLDRTGLLPKANRLAGSLPLLDRKRLELARALATQPDMLLLDEIAGGLTEHEVGALIESIQDIRANGTAVIWIEHIVHALLAVVDRLLVINFGKVLTEGQPAEVMASAQVQEIYLGAVA